MHACVDMALSSADLLTDWSSSAACTDALCAACSKDSSDASLRRVVHVRYCFRHVMLASLANGADVSKLLPAREAMKMKA
jgi:hypothetical protein